MYEFYPIYFIPYGKNIWFYRNWPPQKTSTIFLLLLVDFQYKNTTFSDKLFNLDLPETFLINLSCEVLLQMWTRSVQPFLYLLRRNRQSVRENIKGGLRRKISAFDCYYSYFYLLRLWRKWLIPKNACVHTKSESCNNRKQITLIPKKSFRYYKQ